MAYKTGSATDYVDALNKLRDLALAQKSASATVAAGGSGYVVGDKITLSGGTPETASVFNVDSVSGGAVTAVSVYTAGLYCNGSTPGNPVSTTGGTGTGCTLNVTWTGALGWTAQRESQEGMSATVAAGGTGYAVGDVLTVSGGTAVVAAQFKVTAISGGAVTTVILWSRGNYTVPPSNPAATTGGAGTGCTLNVTFRGVQTTTSQGASSATIGAGGTGYTVGDLLTVSGGTFTTAAVFKVSTVSGGAVTAVTLDTKGDYTATPSNPAATTGGTGTGCTLNVTWASLQPNPDKELILLGDGGGSYSIYVGVKTYNDAGGSGAYNWELAGFSGYQSASAWDSQPGVSPGRASAAGNGAFVPLRNSTITYWFFVSSRRIVAVFKMGTTYSNMYLGLLNAFGTVTEYPYPLAVFGCTAHWNRLYSNNNIGFSGLVDPIGYNNVDQGPAFVRDASGNWQSVQNSKENGGTRIQKTAVVVFPAGLIDYSRWPTEDQAVNGSFSFLKFTPNTGTPGTPTARWLQTPGSPSALTVLFPTIVEMCNPSWFLFGELDAVYWISTVASPTNIQPEDTVTIGSDVYLCFQNCNRTDYFSFFCVRRA